MADNLAKYGFRWVGGKGGRALPDPIECIVATGESFDVTSGAQNVGIGPGDVVTRLSTGGVTLCAGNETTPASPFGVVVGVRPYWSVAESRMVLAELLPSDVAWGTILERQSKLLVVPIDQGYWEVDVDEATTATTLAAYQAFIGENVSFINTGASGEARAKPKIDISTHATTNSLMFRIAAISGTQDNQDYSGANVKIIVEANLGQRPYANTTSTGI